MYLKALFLGTLPALSLGQLLAARSLDQLPLGTFLESIAIRSNGAILTTELTPTPNMWTIRDPTSPHTYLELIATLSGVTAAIGVTEVLTSDGAETFAVTGGNFSSLSATVPGSFGVWTLRFPQDSNGDPTIEKLTDLGPESLAPNGVTSSKDLPDVVFIADSIAGYVGRLDINTGDFTPDVFSYPEMLNPDDTPLPGINGIKVRDSQLYFANSVLRAIYRVPMTAQGYAVPDTVPSLVANISSLGSIIDDFTLDEEGNIYVATNLDNTIIYADVSTNEMRIAAGGLDDLSLAGVTSLAFGRGRRDQKVLYAPTSGALENPVLGYITEGAKVVAVDTSASWKHRSRRGK